MTPERKAELEERASDLASGPISPYEALRALIKVEREVWEKAEEKFLEIYEGQDSSTQAKQKFFRYCRAQAEEAKP